MKRVISSADAEDTELCTRQEADIRRFLRETTAKREQRTMKNQNAEGNRPSLKRKPAKLDKSIFAPANSFYS